MNKFLNIATGCLLFVCAALHPAFAAVGPRPVVGAAGPPVSTLAAAAPTAGVPRPVPSALPVSSPGGVSKGAAPAPLTASGVVNINEATSDELQLLPGIGPSRADAIVAYRKSHPFKRVEELTRIKGIGRKSFLRLRTLLTTQGPTTLKEKPGKATASTDGPLARSVRPQARLNS